MVATILLALSAVMAAAPVGQPDPVAALLARLEQAAVAGDRAAVLALAAEGAERGPLEALATTLTAPNPDRVVIRSRDQMQPGDGDFRLLLEILTERGIQASLATWTLDVRAGSTPEAPLRIAGAAQISTVGGLYRLSLDASKAFSVHNLKVRAPDLSLDMESGSAFVAETPDGPTAIVLIGRGRMLFAPSDPAEQTQVRIFGGDETLTSDFDAAFIRVRPSEFDSVFPASTLRPREVDQRAFRRATDVFEEYIGRTLQIKLSDMSRDRWSLTPSGRDLIVEVRTREFGSLTYTRSNNEAEDIAVFDRRRRRNIAVYASAEKLEERGRFYSEDDLVEYDILAYDLDLGITPERLWVEGTSRLKVRIRARVATTLNLKLAETLTVRSVSSPQFGRLLHLRVVGQNTLLVNLPGSIVEGSEFWVSITYAGPLEPQRIDREAIAIRQDFRDAYIPIEPHFIYSNRSYWYPQSSVTDYAPATLRLSVPDVYEVVATGHPVGPPAPPPGVVDEELGNRHVFLFQATEPVRYIACIISRFNPVAERTVEIDGEPVADIALEVQANPRQAGGADEIADDSADILQFYGSLLGDAPYRSFMVAAVESERPGGHSPPYFAVLHRVVPWADRTWRSDPVSFENYPLFFLAHEIAHQWWGHAIGWKNYHEQWISEGFAQYFAALYAEKQRGPALMDNLLRQMRHTAIDASPQGPIYLGYRLGHIRGDDRVYRAIIYNKGAMVLHMLRRLVGDETFFRGISRFYAEWKFKKAGTDDFRKVMEGVSGRDLTAFFEMWVYGTAIPDITFRSHVRSGQAELTFEARQEIPVAITVAITYRSGEAEEVIVLLTGKVTTVKVPVKGQVRSIVANDDNAALVKIEG